MGGSLFFGPFELRTDSGELCRDGVRVPLQPQPARLLELLARRSGEVVSREEIQQHLWGGETFVDFEQGLNFSIRKIRIALEDPSSSSRYVETVPRRGYRFLVPVRTEAAAAELPVPDPAPRVAWRRPAAAALLVVAAALLILSLGRTPPPGEGAPIPAFAGLTPRAFQAYTEGRYLARKGTPADRERALALLQEAILLAPDFAPAYIACGWTHLDLSRPAEEVVPGAEAAARKALALDPRSGEARAILANVELFFRFDWRKARAELDQALALSPEDPETHQVHAAYLASQGHLDAAVLAARRAQLLDPLSDVVRADLAWYLFLDRRHGEALEVTRQALALQPDDPWTRYFRIDVALAAGEPRTALAQANSILEGLRTRTVTPPPPARVERLLDFWQWRVQWLKRSASQRPISPWHLTIPLLRLGDQEQALQLLAEAGRKRFGWELVFLAVDPRFDPLRERPEFQAILRSLRLAR